MTGMTKMSIDWESLAAKWPVSTPCTKKGSEVAEGEAVAFAPGARSIRFVRIDSEQHTQSAVGMTYRLAYDFGGTGYVLFDEFVVWLAVDCSSASARSVVEG